MNNNIPKYFILASLFFMVLGVIEGVMFPTKFQFQSFYASVLHISPDLIKPFFGTFLTKIHTHVNLVGWVGCALMGTLYFITPQMNNNYKYNRPLAWCNLACHVTGIIIFTIGFHMIGVVGLSSGETPGSVAFRAAVAHCKVFSTIGGILIALSTFIFVFNIIRILFGKQKENI